MATSILDAFVVTFGIDTSDYKAGQREIERGNKQLREESGKTFGDMERKGRNLGQSFRSIRNELAGLLLVFTGTRSLIDFAGNMLRTEAQAGRLGQTIGLATSKVIAWQQAVKQVGGAPGEADSALQSIASVQQDWRLTGSTGSGTSDAIYSGFGITPGDLAKSDPSQILMKIAAARGRFSAEEYARRLQMIGLPQNVIYLLEQGRDKLEKQIVSLEKHANVTEADVRAAQRLNERLVDLQTVVMGKLRPALTWLVEKGIQVVEWLDKTGMLIPIAVGGLAALAAGALAAVGPWGQLALAIAAVVGGLNSLVQSSPETQSWLDWLETPLRKVLPKSWFDRPGDAEIGGTTAGRPTQGQAQTGNYIVRRLVDAGFTWEQARGIAAGIHAESGFDPAAKNPTSGAYGIGQWLGSRKKGLTKRYGANPTLDQQLEYLIWELQGGDKGGPAVGRQTTADYALIAYITKFMRPAAGAETVNDIARGRQFLAGTAGTTPTSSSTTIGQITVNTQATDAKGIAKDMRGELANRGVVTQADSGVAP